MHYTYDYSLDDVLDSVWNVSILCSHSQYINKRDYYYRYSTRCSSDVRQMFNICLFTMESLTFHHGVIKTDVHDIQIYLTPFDSNVHYTHQPTFPPFLKHTSPKERNIIINYIRIFNQMFTRCSSDVGQMFNIVSIYHRVLNILSLKL